jgi:DNA-binding CsgD family transcriptional regulator
MVGRSTELRLALDALEQPGAVVLAGPLGVGKTRLAREVLRHAEARGLTTTWVSGAACSSRIPLGAYAGLLPILRTKRNAPTRDSVEVLLSAREAIIDKAEGRGLVLGVDDAHLLDEASALLTFQIASDRNAVSVVLTVRDGERSSESLTGLWKDGLAERIDLEPLCRAEVATLLAAVLGGRVDGLFLQQAWDASAGNPLYLRELMDAASKLKRLVQVEGLWRTTGPLVTSTRLQQLIEARLADVSASTRRSLEVVAVGEPLDLETLKLVTDGNAIEEAERSGLLECQRLARGSVMRLAHPLYQEVLRAGMPTTRLHEITRTLATALEKTGSAHGDDLVRYVLWRLDTGRVPSTNVLLDGARRCLEGMDLALAERFTRAAIRAESGSSAKILLARVHYRQGKGEQALADLAGLDSTDDGELTEIAVLRAYILLWMLGQADEAEQVLAEAEVAISDDDCRASIAAMRATMLSLAGRPAQTVAIARPLVERGDLSPRPLLSALSALGPGLALAGQGDEAVRVAERGFDPQLRAADDIGTPVNWAMGTTFLAHLTCGRLDQAEQIAELQYERALRLRSTEAQAAGATALGWVALMRGQVTTACSRFKEAEPGLRTTDLFGTRALCCGGLIRALVQAGSDSAAARVLSDVDQARRPGIRWFDPCIELGRVWTLARTNRGAAANLAIEAAEEAEGRGQLPFATWLYHAAVRISSVRVAGVRLNDLAHRCDGPLPQAMAAHACVLIARDAKGLSTTSETFEEMGMMLLAAEAAATVAALRARQGQRAGLAWERAHRLRAACEGAWSSSLEILPPRLINLSPRESAVARLAREGGSNREIAAALGVSARTVESQLGSVYRKLGVGGREDLVDVLAANS